MSTEKDPIRARFAANLKAIRQRMGWSQEVMAGALNVKRSSYSGYENRAAEPDLYLLAALQERFRIGADVMLSSELSGLSEGQWMEVMGMPPRQLRVNPARP